MTAIDMILGRRLFERLIIKSAHALSLVSDLPSGEEISPGVYRPTGAKAVVCNLVIREFNARLTRLVDPYGFGNAAQKRAEVEAVLTESLRQAMYYDPQLFADSRFVCNDVNNSPAKQATRRVYVTWLVKFPHSLNTLSLELNSWTSQQEADMEWVRLGEAA